MGVHVCQGQENNKNVTSECIRSGGVKVYEEI